MGVAGVMLAAGLAAAAGTADPAPGSTVKDGANVITQPDWLRRPTAESMAQEYPKLATALGIEGYAVLACTVTAQGVLADCRASTERPNGLGFGHAAVSLSALFQMRPMTLNGRPVDGGKINIPIRFQLPTGDPPAEPPKPVSDEAAKQALRLVDSGKALDQSLSRFADRAAELETMDPTISPAAGHDASVAFRRAVEAHRGDYRIAWARAFAAVFSEGELSAMADYHGSPAAAARDNLAYVTGVELIRKDYQRNVTAKAREAFCAKVACDVTGDIRKVWRAADPRDTGRIDIPLWEAQPSAVRARRVQPKLAGLLGLTGIVRMTCRVGDKGAIGDCAADEEAPAGLGYGAAALKLAGDYRLSGVQLAAGGVGRKVTVRVAFSPGPAPEPYRPAHGEGHTLALARQLAAEEGSNSQFQLETELQITDMATNPPKGVDDKVYQVAIEAYREGIKRAVGLFEEQTAANLSAVYTEAQLQAYLAYEQTPAGKAERARTKELTLAMASAQAWATQKVIADARTAFCAAHGCAVPAPAAQPSGASAAASTAKP